MKTVIFVSWFPFAFLLNNLYLVDLLKNWCFWTVMLEKTLESPLDAGRSSHSTLRKSTLNIHWKDWCWGWSSNTLATWYKESTHWKRPWCWERLKAGGEAVTEDEMVGWHHRLNGHRFKQTPGDSEGQGSLVCCSPSGHKELDTTEWLNNNKPYEA